MIIFIREKSFFNGFFLKHSLFILNELYFESEMVTSSKLSTKIFFQMAFFFEAHSTVFPSLFILNNPRVLGCLDASFPRAPSTYFTNTLNLKW